MESSPTPRKEKKGLNRLWTKIKLAIRPKSTTKSTSIMPDTSDAPPAPSHARQSMPPIQPETSTQPSTAPPPPPSSVPTLATRRTTTSPPPPTLQPESSNIQPHAGPSHPSSTPQEVPIIENSAEASSSSGGKEDVTRRYERAQAIFKRYNIEFAESAWEVYPRQQTERVHKAPRVRVRWTCHECKTTFGHDKICAECAHQRCRNCSRYPPPKKKAKAAKMAALASNMSESQRDEAQEGSCHECQTTFVVGSEECSNCHHKICDRCLQEIISSVEQTETQPIEA